MFFVPPRMVTCELSRVCCWLRRCQQQFSTCSSQEGNYQEPRTALGAFRKRSVRVVWNMDLLREEGGNIIVKLQLAYKQIMVQRHRRALRHPSPLTPHWEVAGLLCAVK